MRTVFQKSDLVAADLELTQREDHNLLPADFTPGYVDLLSIARGARPGGAPASLVPSGIMPTPSAPEQPISSQAKGPSNQPTHTIFSQRGFTTAATQTQLLPYREGRSYLFIQNHDAANDMYVTFGVRASAANAVKIPAGGFYEPYNTPCNDVYVIGSAVGTVGMVIEGFKNATLQPMSGLEAMQIEHRGMSYAMQAPQQRQASQQRYTVYMPDGSSRQLTDAGYNSNSFRSAFFGTNVGW